MIRKYFTVFSLVLSAVAAGAQIPNKVDYFPVSDVRITSGPFKHAEDMDIRYLLGLDPDRLLAPYLKEAGLVPKAENYTNWENTGLDGHIGGHYLSALSFMYAATGNHEIKQRLEYMISEMKRCQDNTDDGYLAGVPDGRKMWKEIEQGNIRASSFGLNDRWVPLYNIHKTFAGLRDAYLLTGSSDAKGMLIRLTDWMMKIVANLSDDQIQDMLRSEHGGLNEVFADVAEITHNDKYLTLARKFSQKQLLQPLIGHQDVLTGMHANTQIPKVIGYKRIADLEGNNEWDSAASFFWDTVVKHRSISIGGNSVCEHFHPSNDFSSMLSSEQGPETCNTYNMLRLTKMLYRTNLDSHYLDYYERALYNHILSTQDPVQGGFVYFTPMRSGHYRVYSQPQTSFWCCVGSGMENHARYGEMIYAHKDNQLYVNLFIPSSLHWNDVLIEQKTSFPDEESTSIVVTPKHGKKKMEVLFRVPEWVNRNELAISVNDQPQRVEVKDGYLSVERIWNRGDVIRLALPMHLHVESLPDNSSNYSLLYGPIVLASKIGTQDQIGMFADDSRGGHIASGIRLPLQDMPVIVSNKDDILSHIKKIDGKPLTFALSGMYPSKYEGMIIEPFFRLYECRYMVYWPVWSQQEVNDRQEKLAKEERIRIELDKITVDKVVCGEQQPESDHAVEMEKSRNGNDEGKHWREAEGWFSYKMHSKGKSADKLRIQFNSSEKSDAKVLVNGVLLGTFTANGDSHVDFCEMAIPSSQKNKEEYLIKISSHTCRVTPHIYEVRLITNEKE